MSKYSLTIEIDDAIKVKTLVVLADILIKSNNSKLFTFEASDQIVFFMDQFRVYLMGCDEPETDEVNPLWNMIRSMESVVDQMRTLVQSTEKAES
jgi:hypothetical protein